MGACTKAWVVSYTLALRHSARGLLQALLLRLDRNPARIMEMAIRQEMKRSNWCRRVEGRLLNSLWSRRMLAATPTFNRFVALTLDVHIETAWLAAAENSIRGASRRSIR